MNKTQASRLLTLAHFLKTEIDRRQFSMIIYREDTGCGTAACALGWATTIWPETFQVRGGLLYSGKERISYGDIKVETFFGLDTFEACSLFGPDHNVTPIQKAKEIEELVSSKGWVYE